MLLLRPFGSSSSTIRVVHGDMAQTCPADMPDGVAQRVEIGGESAATVGIRHLDGQPAPRPAGQHPARMERIESGEDPKSGSSIAEPTAICIDRIHDPRRTRPQDRVLRIEMLGIAARDVELAAGAEFGSPVRASGGSARAMQEPGRAPCPSPVIAADCAAGLRPGREAVPETGRAPYAAASRGLTMRACSSLTTGIAGLRRIGEFGGHGRPRSAACAGIGARCPRPGPRSRPAPGARPG